MSSKHTLSGALRAAVEADPRTARQLCLDAGVDPAVLSRFRAGLRSLTLTNADKLAAALGLILVPAKQKGRAT